MKCSAPPRVPRSGYAAALSVLLLLSGPAGGVILTEESFDEADYGLWLTCDGRHESVAGWSGNAARIYPPYAGGPLDGCESGWQGYAGISPIEWPGHEPTRVNIRFLILFGPGFADNVTVEGDKLLILMRGYHGEPPADDGPLRWMAHLHDSVRGWEFEIAQNIGNVAATDDLFMDIADRLNEWICVEYEVDLDGNYFRQYMTTRDGVYNETVYIHAEGDDSGCPSAPCFHYDGSYWRVIDPLGGFWNGMSTNHPDSYLMFDELVVADEYIGPPPGFVGGSPPACAFTLSSESASFDAAGGTGEVDLDVGPSGCSPASWTASSDSAFVTITSGSSGAGSGTILYAVAENPGEARSAELTIADRTFTVYQSAAGEDVIMDEGIEPAPEPDSPEAAGDISEEPGGDGSVPGEGGGCGCILAR